MSYRQKADRILIILGLTLGMIIAVKLRYPQDWWISLLYAVNQAALVGGLADWFAVTALFGKPLGITWHTALIPRNRVRIIEGLATAVEQELVSVEAITRRLGDVRLVPYLINWLETEDGRAFFRRLIMNYTRQALGHVDRHAAAVYLAEWVKSRVRQQPVTPHLKKAIAWATTTGKNEQLAILIIDELIVSALKDSTKVAIARYLDEYIRQTVPSSWRKTVVWLAQQTDTLNLEELAATLQEDLVETLVKMKDSDHPIRWWAKQRLCEQLTELESNAAMIAKIEGWKDEIVDRMTLGKPIELLLAGVIDRALLSIELGAYHSPLMIGIFRQAENYLQLFKTNKELQDWLEGYLKEALISIIKSEHSFVGTVVRKALNRFSDEDFNQFIEDKAGEDLAWIRINGAVVGGLIGLLLFLFLHFIYDPYVVPTLQQVISK